MAARDEGELMLTLYSCKGCGSVVIEAILKLCGEEFSLVRWDWDDEGGLVQVRNRPPPSARSRLWCSMDGSIMTESAAIVCWLLQQYPNSSMLPSEPAKQGPDVPLDHLSRGQRLRPDRYGRLPRTLGRRGRSAKRTC